VSEKVLAYFVRSDYDSGNGSLEHKTSDKRARRMRGKNTLVINGKVYDAVTGLAVAAPGPVASVTPQVAVVAPAAPQLTQPPSVKTDRGLSHAKQAHRATQKSSTLRRDVLKKPASKSQVGAIRRKPATGHVARSEQIQRFAPHPQPLKPAPVHPKTVRALDITPAQRTTSSMVAYKQALVAKKPVQAVAKPALSSRALKEQLIAERLAQVDTTSSATTKAPRVKSGLFTKRPRVLNLIVVSFTVMVLGGYLTYLNMPGLSVRVAAAQADVAATFPDYHPDGYRFNGPVAFAPGQVAINFHANGGTSKYTVTEQKSTWDSQAVYDNLVAKAADDSYVTNSQQGLTIYTFKGQAAWVNKGILFTINGDAPLSNEQLLRIAASL